VLDHERSAGVVFGFVEALATLGWISGDLFQFRRAQIRPMALACLAERRPAPTGLGRVGVGAYETQLLGARRCSRASPPFDQLGAFGIDDDLHPHPTSRQDRHWRSRCRRTCRSCSPSTLRASRQLATQASHCLLRPRGDRRSFRRDVGQRDRTRPAADLYRRRSDAHQGPSSGW